MEAHPGTFELLTQHARLNRLQNVELMNVAVGDRSGYVTIAGEDTDESNSLFFPNSNQEFTVPSLRLDDVLISRAVAHVDFLKINIEGAEGLAIRAMDYTIARTDRVCICCHDFKADSGGPEVMRTKMAVTAYLLERGFSVLDNNSAWPDYQRDHVHAVRALDMRST